MSAIFGWAGLFIFIQSLSFQPASAQEPVDREAITVIRKHGLDSSRVMETLGWLTDVYGPRLTGSPMLDSASAWSMKQMNAWGLSNVHKETWGPFGRGWALENFNLSIVSPSSFPLIAYPEAWSPEIKGPVEAEIVYFDAKTVEDFEKYRGKLKGKLILIDEPSTYTESFESLSTRSTADDLLKLANALPPARTERTMSEEARRQYEFRRQRLQFIYDEKPLALLDRSDSNQGYGTVYVAAASVPVPPDANWDTRPTAWSLNKPQVIPQFAVSEEQYNRICRLIQKGFTVRARASLAVKFYDNDPMEYNVIGEIPGIDPVIGDEVVMLGAHLDSWHAGTGASDNAVGCAIMMEATRILQELFKETGKKPRRTIRIALWTGEEQGLFGSRAYVDQHFAETSGFGEPPLSFKPEHEKLSAYYNLDNGSGKIRGIYLQGNDEAMPIFRRWFEPFNDLDAGTITLRNTGGTDHLSFDAAGLPGFQFIQDAVTYRRMYHTNMDVYEHAVPADLKQASTIVASLVYHTAQRDEKIPRKPQANLSNNR